ncbi:recombination exonuclease [Bacillus phage YungSlug]|nr:recombination exonuclease [Bacillus phage YungSlug]
MKAICFGDLHAHMFTDFSEIDEITGNSRFTHVMSCFDAMEDYALENNIKYILFAGDMFHKRVTINTTVFNFVYNRVSDMTQKGLRFIMIPGNHDQVSNEDFPQHSLETFKEIEGVVVLDRFGSYMISDYEKPYYVFPVPYSKNAEMVKKEIEKYAYETTNNGIEKQSILLGHLGLSGAFVGKSNYAMADAFTVEDLFPHAFAFGVFGHFHRGQELGGYFNFFYTGAPLQHNFGDEGQDKGFTVIDLVTQTKEFVPIDTPQFITVTSEELDDLDKAKLEGNFVRYKIDADKVEDLTESLPDDSKHRIEVQKNYEVEKRDVAIDFSMADKDVLEKYMKEKLPEGIDPARALEVGLELLADID